MRAVNIAAAVFIALAAAACKQAPEEQGPRYTATPPRQQIPTYRLAVNPLHNPEKLSQSHQPLIDYLNAQLSRARLELEASRDFGAFEDKIRARAPDFLRPNPWQTLQAMKAGYRVIAMAGAPEDFTGIFIVRRDGNIRLPADLKGKAVSYPSPTAVAACIMQQYFLHEHGVNVNTEIENRYVGSQESSIMNVYLG
ncbi:MAG: PhnD/SsuA/transferrin family substrate-binding protein, partial [Elusimicrobiota bacterium]|nr:PhnD/SsuA/transferrin family substrate-binding protein [Elusimicrobiota bacterium]